MKTNSNPYFHIRVPWTFKLYPQLDVKVTETQISFPCSALQNTAHQPPEGWGKPFTLLSNLPVFVRRLSTTPVQTLQQDRHPNRSVWGQLCTQGWSPSIPCASPVDQEFLCCCCRLNRTVNRTRAASPPQLSPAGCYLPPYSGAQRHPEENLDSKAFGVRVMIPEKMWHKCWERPSSSAGLDVCIQGNAH